MNLGRLSSLTIVADDTAATTEPQNDAIISYMVLRPAA